MVDCCPREESRLAPGHFLLGVAGFQNVPPGLSGPLDSERPTSQEAFKDGTAPKCGMCVWSPRV